MVCGCDGVNVAVTVGWLVVSVETSLAGRKVVGRGAAAVGVTVKTSCEDGVAVAVGRCTRVGAGTLVAVVAMVGLGAEGVEVCVTLMLDGCVVVIGRGAVAVETATGVNTCWAGATGRGAAACTAGEADAGGDWTGRGAEACVWVTLIVDG